jgi:hypothetical protein
MADLPDVEIYQCHECGRVWWIDLKSLPAESTVKST